MEVNRKWKEEYDTLKLQYEAKNESLQKELDVTKEKLVNAETQVLALGSEVTRLAATLNQMYQREGASLPSGVGLDDYEVFKQQVCVILGVDRLSLHHQGWCSSATKSEMHA